MAWWIFQNVVVTTALAAVVAMICRTGRIGPVARHALWVLVLVKFVTPPLVAWPWAVPDPLGIAALDARPTVPDTVVTVDAPPLMRAFETAVDVLPPGATAAFPPGPPARISVAEAGAAAWPWLLGVWTAGSLCLLVIEAVRLLRLTRRIRSAEPDDAALVQRATALAAQLGIRPVPVVRLTGGTSPVVWGFGRPRLLWPADLPADSTDACVDGLLVHELAHIKRRDHLVGWIELAAGIVWWWNPLFWWVRSAMREQAELACDAWVISALPNGRRAYAESLLALSGAALRGPSSSLAVVGIRATSRRVLERRLVMIMTGRSPLRVPFVGWCALALVALASLPAWATAQQPPPPPPPPQVVQPTPTLPAQPPPPPPAPTRAVRAQTQRQVPPPPPPAPARPVARPKVQPAVLRTLHSTRIPANLPAESKELLDAFAKEQETIQQEADRKAAASREAIVKALQDLQERYTKEGKLDEAVAVRDYLRAGGPNLSFHYALFRKQLR